MVGSGAALAGLLLANQARDARAQGSTNHPIVGAWKTSVMNSLTSVGVGLLTFTSSGTVIRVGSSSVQSPASGVWMDAGDGTIIVSYISVLFDASGSFIGTHRTDSRTTVADDGGSYSAVFSSEDRDTQGNLVGTGRGTAQGTRIVAVPPVG